MEWLKKQRGTLLRLGITVLGLWYVATEIDLGELWQQLATTRWGWVFWGFMLVNLSLVLRAYRWYLLLQGLDVRTVKLGRLIELYFVGNFFNAFLPSGFGGDVVRVLEVAEEVPGDVATGTVFLDRFSGLLVLFVIGLLGLPFRPENFPDEWTIIIATICIGGLVGGILLLSERFMSWVSGLRIVGWLPAAISPAGDGPIAKFLKAVRQCGRRAVWQALGVSLIFDVLLVAWWTAATYAIGQPVSYFYNLLVVPIMAIALLAPSFGGLGVREVLAPPLYAGAGLLAEEATAVSVLVFIMLRLSGLLGAPVYLYTIWRKGRRAHLTN